MEISYLWAPTATAPELHAEVYGLEAWNPKQAVEPSNACLTSQSAPLRHINHSAAEEKRSRLLSLRGQTEKLKREKITPKRRKRAVRLLPNSAFEQAEAAGRRGPSSLLQIR